MTAFRVTQNVIAKNSLNNLQASMAKMQQIQNQLSSGRLINKPSDNPSGTSVAMSYRSEKARTEQYSRNATDGLGWLGTADTTLFSALTPIGKVRELILEGANGTADPAAREALALEIQTAKDTLVGLANTSYRGRPIFAGTANPEGQSPPVAVYEADGTYNGNTDPVYRTIGPNADVQVNQSGPAVWGTPGAEDIWHVLDDIQTHLRSSDPAEIAKLTSGYGTTKSDIDRIDVARLNVQNRLSEVGARYHRVEQMQSRADDNLLTIDNGLSEVENIDLAKTIVALNLQNSAYQAALSATAKVIQPSLVDFLS